MQLANPCILFDPSGERRVSGAKQFHDDYKIIPFSKSTQIYKWRIKAKERQCNT